MQKGDVLEVLIESTGMDGEGVAKCDGYFHTIYTCW